MFVGQNRAVILAEFNGLLVISATCIAARRVRISRIVARTIRRGILRYEAVYDVEIDDVMDGLATLYLQMFFDKRRATIDKLGR